MTVTERPRSTRTPSPTDLDQFRLRPPWSWQRKVLGALAIAYAVSFIWGVRVTGLSISALGQGYADFRRLLDRMLPIEFRNFGNIVELAIETFFIAYIGTALAVVLSVPLAFMAARNTTPNRFAHGASRAFIVAMRAIPDLVFALIFVRVIGIGVLPGILAIGLSAIGMVAKLYADAIEQIDEGPREAILATGASRTRSMVTGVMPQVLPAFIGVGLYRLDINFRTSTILGYVGAGGIGSLLQLYLSGLQYPKALGVVVVIVVLVLAVEFISASVRKSIIGGDTFDDRRMSKRLMGAGRRMTSRSAANRTDARPEHVINGHDGSAVATLPFDAARVTPPWSRQRRRMNFWGWSASGLLAYSFIFIELSPLRLLGALVDVVGVGVGGQLIPRDMSWFNQTIWNGIVETLAIGIAASTIGLIVAIPLAFLCARNVAPAKVVYYFGRTLLVLVRALPELIIAVVFVAAVGLGPFPGVLALSIGTIGFGTKLLADSIEEIKQGPRDAIVATGATRMQEALTGVTPQVMPAFIGTSLYVIDINIRAATILGLVGAGGIGFPLIQATRTLDWERVGGILIVIFLVVYSIERLSGWVRKQLI
ncbi:phosphonate ABC transporter, permease protein PhnE [soil metagenome]